MDGTQPADGVSRESARRPRRGRYRPKPLAGAIAPVEHMRARADFLAARRGERRGGRWFTIEVLDRGRTDPAMRDRPPRLGLTVTKKIGGAVLRNRIRRRLREAVRTRIAPDMRPGHDYVIVARAESATVPFEELVAELRARVTRPPSEGRGSEGRGSEGRSDGSRSGNRRRPARRGSTQTRRAGS